MSKETFMEQGFIDILKQLAKEQGSAALTEAKKCKALLADYNDSGQLIHSFKEPNPIGV
jgi:hypothetical protein